jgi:hypothetical protein
MLPIDRALIIIPTPPKINYGSSSSSSSSSSSINSSLDVSAVHTPLAGAWPRTIEEVTEKTVVAIVEADVEEEGIIGMVVGTETQVDELLVQVCSDPTPARVEESGRVEEDGGATAEAALLGVLQCRCEYRMAATSIPPKKVEDILPEMGDKAETSSSMAPASSLSQRSPCPLPSAARLPTPPQRSTPPLPPLLVMPRLAAAAAADLSMLPLEDGLPVALPAYKVPDSPREASTLPPLPAHTELEEGGWGEGPPTKAEMPFKTALSPPRLVRKKGRSWKVAVAMNLRSMTTAQQRAELLRGPPTQVEGKKRASVTIAAATAAAASVAGTPEGHILRTYKAVSSDIISSIKVGDENRNSNNNSKSPGGGPSRDRGGLSPNVAQCSTAALASSEGPFEGSSSSTAGSNVDSPSLRPHHELRRTVELPHSLGACGVGKDTGSGGGVARVGVKRMGSVGAGVLGSCSAPLEGTSDEVAAAPALPLMERRGRSRSVSGGGSATLGRGSGRELLAGMFAGRIISRSCARTQ